MRQPKYLALVFLLPLAAACAAGGSNSGVGASNTGGSTTSGGRGGDTSGGQTTTSSTSGGLSSGFSGSSSTSSGNTSSGGCGLMAQDPNCDACLNASCCQESTDCVNDPNCTACLGTSTPPASCNTDAALAALSSCLQTNCDAQCFGGSSSSSSGSTSSGGALTCNDTNSGIGCCDSAGVLHYCNTQMTVTDQPCTGGTVCGWSAANGYYDCVPPPGGADPSGTNPIACGGGSTSSSSSSSSSTSSSTSSGGGVTWTQLYNGIFGPTGTSSCVAGGGCHTFTQSGFKCGTSKSTCYTGMVNAGLVTPGSSASSSTLADPATSPLCGSLGGSMPKGGTCVTSSQVNQIKSWLASGAPNN
jgi:hypothetical protein